ncbi:flagellar biosynthesis protein FlhB [Planctomycetales bacterium]|nr:flagellar biosynthesis protein FlhB [Planctomycetales bacterium]GHT02266.1 flagellar biosynthesis protein FlhB [Planctomycetales bacterium]GHV18975.1 flagellar biosynthesis protein FlhB [Planctomycetales bacterium]
MSAESEGRTEQPTGQKLQRARREGQVAKSQDLSAATLSLVGTLTIWLLGGWCVENFAACLYRFIFEELSAEALPHDKEVIPYLLMALQYTFFILVPILALMVVAALAIDIYQVGLKVSFDPLKLKFSKLNPVSGMKNLFSKQKVVMLGQNLLKLVFAAAVTLPVLWAAYMESASLAFLVPSASASYCADSAITVALRVSCALLVLSLFDWWYQRYKFNEQMKMTKEEVKDEARSQEGDPQVKQKRRQKQMEMARNRMMKEIPDADVVVRNPTHYAVALKYSPEMAAPAVVAKGKNKIAEKILELAKEARVPMWQDPWLARELYKLEIGEAIPPELFQAVVNILSHVMKKEKMAEFMKNKNAA